MVMLVRGAWVEDMVVGVEWCEVKLGIRFKSGRCGGGEGAAWLKTVGEEEGRVLRGERVRLYGEKVCRRCCPVIYAGDFCGGGFGAEICMWCRAANF